MAGLGSRFPASTRGKSHPAAPTPHPCLRALLLPICGLSTVMPHGSLATVSGGGKPGCVTGGGREMLQGKLE